MMTTDQAGSSTHMSTDPRPADLLIGREKLVGTLTDHVQNGRSVLLVGAAGMGKTAILQAVTQRFLQHGASRTVLYCGEASTLKNTLRSLAEGLYDRQRVLPTTPLGQPIVSRHLLARWPIGKLSRFVLPRIRAGRCVPLLDHLAHVRGAYAAFLDNLVEDLGVPIVAAARSLAPDDTGRLWWIGLKFAVSDVAPLTRNDARRLIEHCLDRAQINLPDRQDFANGVVQRAGGNPRIIVRLCQMAGAPQYRAHGKTDLRLLWLDLKISNLGLPPIADQTRNSLQEEVLSDPLPKGPSEQNSCA